MGSDYIVITLGTVDPCSFPLVWDFNSLKKIWWKGFFDTLPWSILNILSFLRKFSFVLTEMSFLHLRLFCPIFKVKIGKRFFSSLRSIISKVDMLLNSVLMPPYLTIYIFVCCLYCLINSAFKPLKYFNQWYRFSLVIKITVSRVVFILLSIYEWNGYSLFFSCLDLTLHIFNQINISTFLP